MDRLVEAEARAISRHDFVFGSRRLVEAPRARNSSSTAPIGSPGASRGMMKFKVAASITTTKNMTSRRKK